MPRRKTLTGRTERMADKDSQARRRQKNEYTFNQGLDNAEALLGDAMKWMKTHLQENDSRDEHSIYGELIAHKFRTCNASFEDIAIAQTHIKSIVFNLTMGIYQHASNSPENDGPVLNQTAVPEPSIIRNEHPNN